MTTHKLDEASRTLKIEVAGDLLSTNYDLVNGEIQALLARDDIRDNPWTVLFLDLSAARLIDSMGLNILVSLVKKVQAPPRNGRVKTRITSPTIHRTLLFTRLEKYMEVELVVKTA
jgi:anti-anti-sigma factor